MSEIVAFLEHLKDGSVHSSFSEGNDRWQGIGACLEGGNVAEIRSVEYEEFKKRGSRVGLLFHSFVIHDDRRRVTLAWYDHRTKAFFARMLSVGDVERFAALFGVEEMEVPKESRQPGYGSFRARELLRGEAFVTWQGTEAAIDFRQANPRTASVIRVVLARSSKAWLRPGERVWACSKEQAGRIARRVAARWRRARVGSKG
jgi:hypothetical protein